MGVNRERERSEEVVRSREDGMQKGTEARHTAQVGWERQLVQCCRNEVCM